MNPFPKISEARFIDARNLLSTTDLSHTIGFNISKDFIVNKLEIYPSVETHLGFYWSKDKVTKVKLALAKYLVEDCLENSKELA
jgi:hypothetical protein